MTRRPPSTCTDPPWGRSSPASTLRSVVFPAPLGPKIARVCPGARRNETSSSATTRPKACRSPSARTIDAGGEVFHVERFDEVPRMAEVEHVDQRLHADVRRGHDDGERRAGLADLLEQRDAVGVREAEVEDQDFGLELLKLAPGLAAARGERQVVARREDALVGAPQGRLILDEQDLPARRPSTHGGPNILEPPGSSTGGSARAAFQLEQVVEFGEHQEEAQLFVRAA